MTKTPNSTIKKSQISVNTPHKTIATTAITGLLAGILLTTTPATAEDSITADYTATFQACPPETTPAYQFEDVPRDHPNANNVACIAYYHITLGTTHTTYSPATPVTRQQMALFLTRLAERAGITIPQPKPTNFTDINNLGTESQHAISQLAQMGITKGTTPTTFSPQNPVTRGQMALLIQRLMNQMTPMEGHGYIPNQVNLTNSPFRDISNLNTETKEAIGRLWNMGVITGYGNVLYNADAHITRNTMASYITGVLNHSNTRPEGLTIQSEAQTLWGTQTNPLVAISYRDKNFQPPTNPTTIDIFTSNNQNITTCHLPPITGDCIWSTNDPQTNHQGNILFEEPTPVNSTKTFYAWTGTKNNQKFDSNKANYRTATIKVNYPEEVIVIGTTLNHHTLLTNQGKPVNYNDISEVTVVGALKSDTGNTWVERAGLRVNVKYEQGNQHTETTDHITDKWGRIQFQVAGPNKARTDRFVFTLYNKAGQKIHQNTETWNWTNEKPQPSSDSVQTNIKTSNNKTEISITVSVWDQYGVPWTQNNDRLKIVIWLDDDPHFEEQTETGNTPQQRTLTANQGSATWVTTMNTHPGQTLHIKYDIQYTNNQNIDTYIDRAAPANQNQNNDGTTQIYIPYT